MKDKLDLADSSTSAAAGLVKLCSRHCKVVSSRKDRGPGFTEPADLAKLVIAMKRALEDSEGMCTEVASSEQMQKAHESLAARQREVKEVASESHHNPEKLQAIINQRDDARANCLQTLRSGFAELLQCNGLPDLEKQGDLSMIDAKLATVKSCEQNLGACCQAAQQMLAAEAAANSFTLTRLTAAANPSTVLQQYSLWVSSFSPDALQETIIFLKKLVFASGGKVIFFPHIAGTDRHSIPQTCRCHLETVYRARHL